MKSMTLLKLKNELKLTADLIKQKKPIFRQAVSVTTKAGGDTSWHNKELGAIEAELAKLRFDFRHRHIVYCLIAEETKEVCHETVCASAG